MVNLLHTALSLLVPDVHVHLHCVCIARAVYPLVEVELVTA